MDETKKELAQVMFEAYNAEGPNPNKTWDGKDVPPWSELGPQVTGKWRAAAKAAVILEMETGSTFGIGAAVKAMHNGLRVQRLGWNGKGMWLALQTPDEHSKMLLPYVFLHNASGKLVPWNASQEDLLAIDWTVVPVM